MNKNTLFILILSGFALSLAAQHGQLIGQVISKTEVLPYATIQISPGHKGSTTDQNGQYQINGLESGEYILSVSYVGFQSVSRPVNIISGEITEVNFELISNLSLEEIVVTGTMKPTYVSDSPIKVDVITSRMLDTYIPSASSSVIEGIQLVNGVQEVVACGVCFTNSISINGLDGAYTAVLMDGTPMFGNLASVYGLNGIPNTIIDRFEIIKGPSSTLYGSEAVAGVINIITKDPKTQPAISFDIMGTSHKESFGNLSVAPRIGKSHGYIGLNYAYINDFDDHNDDGFGDGINLDRYSLFTKWNIHRPSGKKFSIAAKYYYEDRRNGVEAFVRNRAYQQIRGSATIYGESIYTDRVEMFGTYEFNSSPNLRFDFSFSNHLQDSYYGADHYDAKQRIAYGNLIFNPVLKNHDIIIGATARMNQYDDNTVATQRVVSGTLVENAPDNQFIPGIFFQDEITMNDNFTVLAGARLDHYSSHGLIFAPRLNLKYKPSQWTTVRTNFGTGFRVVNLFTEDHAFITGQRKIEITEELDPERSYNLSMNVNHVFSFLNGTGSADVEAYYTHFTNKILPDYNTPGSVIYSNSTGFARTMGIGLNINYSLVAPLAFNIGYNIQSARETELDDRGTLVTRDIEFAPKWSAIFVSNYNWEKPNITFAYTVRMTGKMALPEVFDLDEDGRPLPYSRKTTSKPFAIQNFQLTKIFNRDVALYLGIQNIFNYRQEISPLVGYNDPNAAIGFSEFFDTSYAYSPNHGREYYLGMKWSFGVKDKK